MRLKIAARQSDLARLQAYQVAAALGSKFSDLDIEFQFRASLGDLNQQDPLWKMPERGVFTEDFVQDLETGNCDLVVHSWKDLPTEPRKLTRVVATLPRADVRDVLLFRKDRIAQFKEQGLTSLKVLTSSPRRAYNLEPFLAEFLPFKVDSVEFISVRGNIPTRLNKLLGENCDALVVAKAALDRLLLTHNSEFAETQKQMREVLHQCNFMVLPLSLNPTAAAQAALAIEIKADRADLIERLKAIHCETTWRCVELEREVLSGYGGGCHQKIGVSVLERPYGRIMFLRGLTDAGEILNQAALSSSQKSEKVGIDKIWPVDPRESFFFNREPVIIKSSPLSQADLIWVARETAWSEGLPITNQLVWGAGLQTWKKLAARGIWVNGSSEGLGEAEAPQLEALSGKANLKIVKLTHAESPEIPPMKNLPTYKLVPKASAEMIAEQLSGKTHFFWMSGTSFDEALKHHPEIVDRHHACGPGHTYTHLKNKLGENAKIKVYLSYEDWKSSLT